MVEKIESEDSPFKKLIKKSGQVALKAALLTLGVAVPVGIAVAYENWADVRDAWESWLMPDNLEPAWKLLKASGYEMDIELALATIPGMLQTNGFDAIDAKEVSHRVEFVKDPTTGELTGLRDTGKPAFGTGRAAVMGLDVDGNARWRFVADIGPITETQYADASEYYEKKLGAKKISVLGDTAPDVLTEIKSKAPVTHENLSTTAVNPSEAVQDLVKEHGGFVDRSGRAWQIWVDKDGKTFATRLPDSMKANLPYQDNLGVWHFKGKLI